MKKNALKELLLKSEKELTHAAKSARSAIAKLYLDKKTGKEKNTEALGNKRRDLAQILTVKHLKELSKS